jgi:hypothetical protein
MSFIMHIFTDNHILIFESKKIFFFASFFCLFSRRHNYQKNYLISHNCQLRIHLKTSWCVMSKRQHLLTYVYYIISYHINRVVVANQSVVGITSSFVPYNSYLLCKAAKLLFGASACIESRASEGL